MSQSLKVAPTVEKLLLRKGYEIKRYPEGKVFLHGKWGITITFHYASRFRDAEHFKQIHSLKSS